MRNQIELLLAEFVNREREVARFREILDSAENVPVFTVWGPGGVGKSSLKAKLLYEVTTRGISTAEVVWSETRNHDFMAIARKIRDDLGAEHFEKFTDLINFFTVPQYELKVSVNTDANISVAEGAQITEGASVADISGVMIKDVMLTQPRSDIQVSASERRARLTDAFLDDIAAALDGEPAVVFFDATEKMTDETEQWLWGELLRAAIEGKLKQTMFLLFGRKEPDVPRLWRDAVEVVELKPLSREHLLQYLDLRGVEKKSHAPLADMLLVVTQGNMLDVATHVDGYLKMQMEAPHQAGRSP